ncbi:MAG: membrane protein insertion efficiency factor YidD [Elusimicrobiales bacterium]|nr:membrane protein insertion efficiency factor YidD [Elusimicrobiales bacterium]
MRKVLVAFLVGCVRFYQQTLHGFIGYGHCKFTPSCSAYMIEALQVHGPLKGLLLGAWRILRCNPFSHGGYDPVPPKPLKEAKTHE